MLAVSLLSRFLGFATWMGVTSKSITTKALRLLTAAAKRGAPRAKANLARMYAEGLGVKKDLSKGMRLYEEAANAGEFFAQIELARIYSRGLGVPANPVVAFKWYSPAAALGVEDCEELREAKRYAFSGKSR
jgi:TPR repeat protein